MASNNLGALAFAPFNPDIIVLQVLKSSSSVSPSKIKFGVVIYDPSGNKTSYDYDAVMDISNSLNQPMIDWFDIS